MMSFEIGNGDEITSLTIKCPKNTKFLMPAGAATGGCPCCFALICITAPGDACLWELFHPRSLGIFINTHHSPLTSHHSPLTTHHSLPLCTQQNLYHYLIDKHHSFFENSSIWGRFQNASFRSK